jgi:integrase/recombinase XerD
MLIDTVNTYLSLRRAAERGDQYVVSKTAIDWAAVSHSEGQRANRLNLLIRFAQFAHAEDKRHEIPSKNVFCSRKQRRMPYLFTDEEVELLVLQAKQLSPSKGLRPLTYSTLFGLLASTGIRISEAISLRLLDITPEGLIIRETKFRKSRLIWLHETVVAALKKYLDYRCKIVSDDDHVFISRRGRKLNYNVVDDTFQKVVKAAGIQRQSGKSKPRLHDFRHRFAVKALEACPDNRDRVASHMLALSTYMGHARLESTYWYLNTTAQLMRDVADVCESFSQGGIS